MKKTSQLIFYVVSILPVLNIFGLPSHVAYFVWDLPNSVYCSLASPCVDSNQAISISKKASLYQVLLNTEQSTLHEVYICTVWLYDFMFWWFNEKWQQYQQIDIKFLGLEVSSVIGRVQLLLPFPCKSSASLKFSL